VENVWVLASVWAETEAIGLVVLDCRGRSKVLRMMVGSVSERA
jgi:nucleotide-binding universal stress UspA family protein